MHWRTKGLLQKLLGHLPGGEPVHYLLQKKFGGLRSFDREFDVKMEDWRLMAHQLRDAGFSIAGSHLFEIGSGWYPTFPFACYLGGVRAVHTVDLSRHIKPELVRSCAASLGRYIRLIAESCGVSEDDVRERQQHLVHALAGHIDINAATRGVVTYDAPADAASTHLAAESIDCVFSNSVLEHVMPTVIDDIYREAMRILTPDGIMFHSVNCGDHYAYIDHRINQLNYLHYSDAQWKRWNNAFLYQNRLRADVFTERAEAAGFTITYRVSTPPEKRLHQLAALDVDPQFLSIPPERLCVTSIDFIARKSVAGAPR